MIGQVLRQDIEAFASHLARTNPLVVSPHRGAMDGAAVARYLVNVRQLVRLTPAHLRRARRRAVERGMPALAAAYSDKLVEELGHDQWADDDLARLRAELGVQAPARHVPALDTLGAHISETIDRDPVLYLAYMLLAEYVTVLLGPEWLRSLEQRCGIPPSLLTVLAKHVELDRDHVDDGLDQIDALVDDPRYLTPMREALQGYMAHLERFFAQVGEPEDIDVGTGDAADIGAALPAGA